MENKIEITNESDYIRLILESIYIKEYIITKDFKRIESKNYQTTLNFPQYRKALDKSEHASTTQITEALIEGLYISSANAIYNKDIDIGISLDDFIKKEGEFIIHEIRIKFNKPVIPEKNYKMEIFIRNVKFKELKNNKNYYELNYEIKGIVLGNVQCRFLL